ERGEPRRRRLHDPREPLAGGGPTGARRLHRHRARRRLRGLRCLEPRRAAVHPGPLLGPCPPQVRGGRTALPGAVRRGARPHWAPLRRGAGVSPGGRRWRRWGPRRGPAAARRVPSRAVGAPIIAELCAWAHRQALPESSLGKATAYMLGLWPGLTRFLDDPRIPLDNNATERGLRGVVVGRKNHYGLALQARHRG